MTGAKKGLKGQKLSLSRGARLADMSVSQFVTHLSQLGIPVINLNAEETKRDRESLGEWLASS
jgi:predicted HTH domain antitoxin